MKARRQGQQAHNFPQGNAGVQIGRTRKARAKDARARTFLMVGSLDGKNKEPNTSPDMLL